MRAMIPHLSWSWDTLIFTPPDSFWYDAETVYVELYAADIYGTRMIDEPLSWTFYTDFSPPIVWGEYPTNGSIVRTVSPDIRINIADSLSGLDEEQLIVTVGDEFYRLTDIGLSYDSWTEELWFNLASAGISFEDGESVNVCIRNIMDMPNYCPPNLADDYCWYFIVDIAGPIATLLEPFDGAYSSCADQGVTILLEDVNGIDPTSIYLQVGSISYTIGSSELELIGGDTLVFTPPGNVWADGQIVDIILYEAMDTIGNSLQDAPVSWSFTVDLSPPVVLDTIPIPNSLVGDRSPTVSFRLEDYLSGLDSSSIIIHFGDTTLTIEDTGVYFDDGAIRIESEELGLIFPPEDTVGVCVFALDSPDYCPPNTLDVCWNFIISLTGPWATLLEPFDNAISACKNQGIVIRIEDNNGIDQSTIQLSVNDSIYDISSPELD